MLRQDARDRSSLFWSATRTRKSRCVWASSDVEQTVQLGDAVDRRDDEIECHGRTLTAVPLVSVLLAVHNDARFLDLAIASVLGQTLDDLELVVVDDASTDETPAALAALDDPRVVTLRNDERSAWRRR